VPVPVAVACYGTPVVASHPVAVSVPGAAGAAVLAGTTVECVSTGAAGKLVVGGA